jgi:hypothetical protein
MIDNLAAMKSELSELAAILNAFKSEAVQLRILDMVFGREPSGEGQELPQGAKVARRQSAARKFWEKGTPDPNAGKRKKAAAGTGAPATLGQLLTSSFFSKPQTINNIIDHCKHNLARTFKANEFSGKLGRMVRAGELTRKKNADNQYEYQKP